MKQRQLFEPRAPAAKRPRRSTKVPHTIRPELKGPAHVVLRIVPSTDRRYRENPQPPNQNTGLLRARTLRFNFACPLDAPLFL